MITDQLKQIISWVGLGASLVVYAHANFPTKETVNKLEEKVERQASRDDMQATRDEVKALGEKIDKLTHYLLNKGN